MLRLSVAQTIALDDWMAVNNELETTVRKKPWFNLTCLNFVKQLIQ
jgi:hypothetical protein